MKTTPEGRAEFVATMPPRDQRPAGEFPGAAWWVIDLIDDIDELLTSLDEIRDALGSEIAQTVPADQLPGLVRVLHQDRDRWQEAAESRLRDLRKFHHVAQ